MVQVANGCEVRGFMIRLYPSKEQAEELETPQEALRLCWNWLCKQTEEVLEATKCQAVREGLVPDPGHRTKRALPCFPPIKYEGMSPDEAKAAKAERSARNEEWHKVLMENTKDMIQWRPRLNKIPGPSPTRRTKVTKGAAQASIVSLSVHGLAGMTFA